MISPSPYGLLCWSVAFFACCACTKDSTPSKANPDRTFRVAMWDPETLDPSLAADESSVTIARALFEGLLRPPVGDGAPRFGVARDHEISADGLVHTFRLRPDARWSDGRPVTAQDFVYAWTRVLDPETGSRSAPLADVIEGAQAFRRGQASSEDLGVRALDAATLEVRLSAPAPWFPHLLTYPAFAPVRQDVVKGGGKDWTRPGRIVGNGAFVLVEHDPKVRVVLEKNPHYWNAESVSLERVEFYFLESERTAWDWYRLGRVDWLKGTLTRDLIPEARRLGGEFHADPVLCTYFTAVRITRPPLDDERLRRAMDLAVDKERLVREVLMGEQTPARSLVPPVIQGPTGYVPPSIGEFDPASARTLLARIESERGPIPPLTWLYNQGEVHRMIGEFLQAQWRQHLGIEVRLQALEWKMLLDRLRRGDFELARASWCADVVDPANFIEVFESKGPSNYSGFADAELDRLIAEARKEQVNTSRLTLLREAETRLLAARPILPLYHYTRLYLLNPRVRGFQPNLLDVHPLEDIFFAQRP